MRLITTSLHGLVDYTMAALLVAVPLLAQWDIRSQQATVLVVLGLGMFAYSLLTRYDLGAVGVIRMELHLALDLTAGVLLVASPWYLGFSHYTYMPHVVLGLLQIATTLISEGTPRRELARQF